MENRLIISTIKYLPWECLELDNSNVHRSHKRPSHISVLSQIQFTSAASVSRRYISILPRHNKLFIMQCLRFSTKPNTQARELPVVGCQRIAFQHNRTNSRILLLSLFLNIRTTYVYYFTDWYTYILQNTLWCFDQNVSYKIINIRYKLTDVNSKHMFNYVFIYIT
jgi:hypothetical protein